MSEVSSNLECLRHEYSEVNNNIRHYSGLRFAIFGVYFAVIGGISTVAFGFVDAKPNSNNIAWWAKIGGLLVTFVFFSFEALCDRNLRHLGKVARQLEKSLQYIQFRSRRAFFKLRAIHFTTILYIALIAFWIIAILGRV